MPQTINTNIASLSAQRALNTSQSDVNTSLQRLSSGLRINSAKDDAAGLAISERFNSQVRGLNQAVRNANDAISLTQTAESALSETTSLLQRLRELSIQSANSTNSSADREALQAEVTQLSSEIDRIANTTQFNGLNLLDGTFTSQNFQVGANQNQTVGVTLNSAKASALGGINTVDFSSDNFESAMISVANTTNAGSAIEAQNLTFTVGGGASQVASVAANASAADIASAVNANITGLSASAATQVRLTSTAGDSSGQKFTLSINGTNLGQMTVGASDTATYTTIAAGIQAKSELAGLTVSNSSAGVVISNTDGSDIVVDVVGAETSAGAALSTQHQFTVEVLEADGAYASTSDTISSASTSTGEGVTVTGAVQYTTTRDPGTTFTAVSNLALGVAAGGLGTSTATITATAGTESVSSIDISTVNGAQTAIAVIDSAIATVSSSRASIGALQNRFESVVSSLQSNAENQASARSRIVDADFAAETASLTRGQILQQAGIAVLAQANAAPQNVLALLQ